MDGEAGRGCTESWSCGLAAVISGSELLRFSKRVAKRSGAGQCPSWWRCAALSGASQAEQLRKKPPATASTSCTPPDPRGGASVLVEFAQHDPGEHMGDRTITRRCTFDSTQSIADLNQTTLGIEQIRAAELPPVVVHRLDPPPDSNHILIRFFSPSEIFFELVPCNLANPAQRLGLFWF